jgi:hypothetical protein
MADCEIKNRHAISLTGSAVSSYARRIVAHVSASTRIRARLQPDQIGYGVGGLTALRRGAEVGGNVSRVATNVSHKNLILEKRYQSSATLSTKNLFFFNKLRSFLLTA